MIKIIGLHKLVEDIGTQYHCLRNCHPCIFELFKFGITLHHIINEGKATAFSSQRTVADTGKVGVTVETVTFEDGNHSLIFHLPVLHDRLEDNPAVCIYVLKTGPRDRLQKLGYRKSPEEYLRENKEFISTKGGKEEVSTAAMLLFGKNPKHYFPRARIRFVRYEGTEAKVGAEMNVIKDVVFEGRVLQVIEKALEFVRSQIKERTYLGADTRFVTEPEYPEFAWKELIVNAVAHRDYSIKGTDIQIKMFDDRLTVESPGTLPGIVRLNNMRHVHFSRNPKIAQFLHEYEYVQEFGEGVDRLYEVMETAGLPQPEYRVEAFMLYATIRNTKTDANLGDTPQVTPQVKIIAFCSEPRSKAEIANHCGFKDIKHFTARYLKPLLESGQLRMTAPDKPNSSKQKYITVQPSQ